jgi:peptidoglycan/LPS O-acetylase OafA/YrhL
VIHFQFRFADGRRLPELDSLRGIAAVCVLLFHLSYYTDPYHQFPFRFPWGHYGVELFFVISGFVILMTLERSASTTEFVVARVTRLYPAYWCAVLFTTCVVALLTPSKAATMATVAVNLTMVQALVRVINVDPSYWTLTLELVFYLLLGVWFRFRGAGFKNIETYAIGWMLAATLLRTVLLLEHRELPDSVAMPLLLYYGQFFIIGICLYRFYSNNFSSVTILTLIGACSMSLFGGASASLNPAPARYFLVTCAITAVVFLASHSRLPLLRNPVLIFFGEISFPLYLIHQKAGETLMSLAYVHHWRPWLSIPAVLLTLVAVAFLIHELIEVPARTLLRPRLQKLLAALSRTRDGSVS